MTIELTKEQLDVGEKIIKGIKNRKAIVRHQVLGMEAN